VEQQQLLIADNGEEMMNVAVILAGLLFGLIGSVIGGVLGFLIGLGALALPGMGPMVAAGTLATTLATAGVGALLGLLPGGVIGCLGSIIIGMSTSRL